MRDKKFAPQGGGGWQGSIRGGKGGDMGRKILCTKNGPIRFSQQ